MMMMKMHNAHPSKDTTELI